MALRLLWRRGCINAGEWRFMRAKGLDTRLLILHVLEFNVAFCVCKIKRKTLLRSNKKLAAVTI